MSETNENVHILKTRENHTKIEVEVAEIAKSIYKGTKEKRLKCVGKY
jgi:hypothetical protein